MFHTLAVSLSISLSLAAKYFFLPHFGMTNFGLDLYLFCRECTNGSFVS